MSEFFRFSTASKSKVYAYKILNRDDYFTDCCECGSVYLKNKIGNVELVIEGRGKYPDILLCGHWPMLIVSDKVLSVWRENNISGFQNYSVKLFRDNGDEIPKNVANYHHIIITGRCVLDLDAMGIKVTNKCNTCGIVKYNKESWKFGIPIVKRNSWDGSDLFVFEQFVDSSLCVRKNLELIHSNKLTNFSVTRMEDMFDYLAEDIDIKELLLS